MLIFPVIFHACELQTVARQKNICSANRFLRAPTDQCKTAPVMSLFTSWGPASKYSWSCWISTWWTYNFSNQKW